jgi:hypothetical protein
MVCFTVYSCYCENSHFDFEYPSRTNCSFDGLGMRKTSFGWESGVPAGHRLWCLPLFFRVTACTLGSLQPQLMLLPQTAASQFSTIPGNFPQTYCTAIVPLCVQLLQNWMFVGHVHQNSSYHFPSTSRLFFTHGYRWVCGSGCSLRLRNLVSAGEVARSQNPNLVQNYNIYS